MVHEGLLCTSAALVLFHFEEIDITDIADGHWVAMKKLKSSHAHGIEGVVFFLILFQQEDIRV